MDTNTGNLAVDTGRILPGTASNPYVPGEGEAQHEVHGYFLSIDTVIYPDRFAHAGFLRRYRRPRNADDRVGREWLETNLNDPNLVLLHIGVREEYDDAGHIRARHLSRWMTLQLRARKAILRFSCRPLKS